VCDVGANIGGFGNALRRIGFKGSIHSFEPASSAYAMLESQASKDDNWRTYKLAFGETAGSVDLNLMVGSELSSFLEPLQTSPKMKKTDTETVQVRTLDEFEKLSDWSKTFIKIDTQGHDLAVMRGGASVLKLVPMLQTEISVIPIYRDMPTFVEAIQYIDRIGFDVTGLFPVSRDNHLRVIEFDCVAVNRNAL
jgi:FkbM family methyltransferase